MVNIVHEDICWDDNRNITAIEIKLKLIQKETRSDIHQLVAIANDAFLTTTLFTDAGRSYSFTKNEERNDIVDMKISIEKPLTRMDVSRFIDAFQENMDNSKLFTECQQM